MLKCPENSSPVPSHPSKKNHTLEQTLHLHVNPTRRQILSATAIKQSHQRGKATIYPPLYSIPHPKRTWFLDVPKRHLRVDISSLLFTSPQTCLHPWETPGSPLRLLASLGLSSSSISKLTALPLKSHLVFYVPFPATQTKPKITSIWADMTFSH